MQAEMRTIALGVALLSYMHLAGSPGWAHPARQEGCQVVQKGKLVELRSPAFVFRLDTSAGLRAQSWENRLAGQTISLGGGPELELDIGLPEGLAETPTLRVIRTPMPTAAAAGECVFQLAAEKPRISARLTYRWNAEQPVLRKLVEIENNGNRELNRLLNVRLGTYRTRAKVSSGERGFPVYLNDEFFMSLAHPAGWATGTDGEVGLRQYPGTKLAPGAKFQCMETVYGVGQTGGARKTFLAHVRSRMRRVVRGHDKPYAIFEPFGARPGGSFDETEEFVLDMIAKVAEGAQQSGCRFDLFSVDFWVDYHGDLKRCDPKRFPNGLTNIKRELGKLGTAPGLWIDSSWELWSIGGNPAVRSTCTHDPEQEPKGRVLFCRATEPIKSMYTEAFRHHIRENGARLLKFDNLHSICNNPNHEHLPGIYSTEPITNAVIEFFGALDEECPDVFLMGYWGYRSPWWLLHADTLFDSGIHIEAASPSDLPAPYARDSVTQKLDQAQRYANDVPPLGKDSLGVWLSDWGWNSSIGKERWQGGFVMDICRGSMLAQPWSDYPWLSPSERKQMADFIALLKARPECFGNPRFILGDPWKDEPYGYCCSEGNRAFLALNNCAWNDSDLRLKLNSAWGLPDGKAWDLYRWYPDPVRFKGDGATFGSEVSIALRPFEVVLLEVVPAGQPPTLDRTFDEKPILTRFTEASRSVEITVERVQEKPEPESASVWMPLEVDRFVSAGGATLTKQKDGSILASGDNPACDTYTITAGSELKGITAIRLEVLPDRSLPGNGPGRAVNGNFALTEFRVTAAPRGSQTAAVPVVLKKAVADFSQQSHGGWPVAAAIDGDPKTGWSVDPQEGLRHVAIFETQKPAGFAPRTALIFTLKQGERGHNIGRLRLSATTAKPPIPLPKGYGPRRLILRGQAPASSKGGMLVVTVQLSQGTSAFEVRNVGTSFSVQGKPTGEPIRWEPVLGKRTYPASWQAWRIPIEPSTAPRPFELTITTTLTGNVNFACKGHFIPE